MLDITVPDAVLILGAGTALLTAYLGTQKGNTARREAISDVPAPSIAGLLSDVATVRELAEAVKQLAAAVRQASRAREFDKREQQADRLEELVARLAEREARGG